MSYFTFIVSDTPLKDVINNHITYLSVNEALSKGIAVSDIVLNSETIDRDKPGVLLYIEDEEKLNEITIQKIDKDLLDSEIPIALKYVSTLEWVCNKERAKQLVSYIKEHLKKSEIIEVWHIWLGNSKYDDATIKKHIDISNLLPTDFEEMFTNNSIDEYSIKITR